MGKYTDDEIRSMKKITVKIAADYDGTIRLLKPIKAQGTLENKIILAQFVALFQTMEYFKTGATRFSFVVDSPLAKEASI